MTFTCSSSSRPTEMGVRRTWNALVPITAPVRFSLTYAFIPWMTATTTTRKPTETMMPRRVKKERSLLVQNGLEGEPKSFGEGHAGKLAEKEGEREREQRLPLPLSSPLLVPQRLHRIQPCRPVRRIEPEEDPGDG